MSHTSVPILPDVPPRLRTTETWGVERRDGAELEEGHGPTTGACVMITPGVLKRSPRVERESDLLARVVSGWDKCLGYALWCFWTG